jgi:hypothetical protein
MIIRRRGLFGLLAAPVIVRVGALMPVSVLDPALLQPSLSWRYFNHAAWLVRNDNGQQTHVGYGRTYGQALALLGCPNAVIPPWPTWPENDPANVAAARARRERRDRRIAKIINATRDT